MIDQIIKCQWCEGAAIQSGTQYLGFGINSLSYQCRKCKAITLIIRNTEKEIDSIEYTLKYKE